MTQSSQLPSVRKFRRRTAKILCYFLLLRMPFKSTQQRIRLFACMSTDRSNGLLFVFIILNVFSFFFFRLLLTSDKVEVMPSARCVSVLPIYTPEASACLGPRSCGGRACKRPQTNGNIKFASAYSL